MKPGKQDLQMIYPPVVNQKGEGYDEMRGKEVAKQAIYR
jgi:hypothetical protein